MVDVIGRENERVGGNASPEKDDNRMFICCAAIMIYDFVTTISLLDLVESVDDYAEDYVVRLSQGDDPH